MAEALLDHDPPAATAKSQRDGHNRARALLREPKVVLAGGFILFLIFLAVFAPMIAPRDPLEQDLLAGTLPPVGFTGAEPGFLLGTDDLGRDVLSRLIFGTRIALIVAFSAATLAALLGTAWIVAGYFRGQPMRPCRGWLRSGWRFRRCYSRSWSSRSWDQVGSVMRHRHHRLDPLCARRARRDHGPGAGGLRGRRACSLRAHRDFVPRSPAQRGAGAARAAHVGDGDRGDRRGHSIVRRPVGVLDTPTWGA